MSSGGKIGGYIASRCLSDPYIQLIHCRRSIRFLKIAKSGGANILVLGNKYKSSINFGGILSGNYDNVLKVTSDVLVNATRFYDLILCFDPILYGKYLNNINLPCVAVCNIEDLYHHRDLPDVFDYIIPFNKDVIKEALTLELGKKW